MNIENLRLKNGKLVAKLDVFRYNMAGDHVKEKNLIDKSIDFGARIVKLHRYLVKTTHEAVLSMQILRSGTSIGANINEAQYGSSKADFFCQHGRGKHEIIGILFNLS